MAETSIEWTDATWNPVAGCATREGIQAPRGRCIFVSGKSEVSRK
jgi:protein gp37